MWVKAQRTIILLLLYNVTALMWLYYIVMVSQHATYEMWKAHWCMRVVCDADRVDDCEIKKDKTRLNEIKAMKQAWEAMEEGRAARVSKGVLTTNNVASWL